MYLRILLLLIATLLLGCVTEAPDTEQVKGTETRGAAATTDQRDSLREAYLSYYAKLSDTLPRHCRPEAGTVNPADEAPTDTAFFVFREHLREVVAKRDIFGLLPLVDENIKVGFGAEGGLPDFIRAWELTEPDKVPQSPLWLTLSDLLALGGGFSDDGGYFEAPYISHCWPHDAEPYEMGVIAGAGVRLRSAPSLQSDIVKVLSHKLVTHLEQTTVETAIDGRTFPWIKVRTPDGLEGYVYGRFYRSPLDYRAIFKRNDAGEWRLVTLVAGD